MKSTDTILGAFAILGFALLAFFAFAGSTDDSEIDTTELSNSDEEILVTDAEIVTEETLDSVDAADQEDVMVDAITNEMIEKNLLADLDPSSIRSGVESFLQGGNNPTKEELLGTLQGIESEVAAEVDLQAPETEITNVDAESSETLLETQATDSESNIDTTADDEVLAVDDQESQTNTTKEPGRISKFFSNLFGGDDDTENDNTPDIGGSAEDTTDDSEITDEVPTATGSYVVRSGDNVWDILTNDLGYTNSQAADAINQMRTDSGFADDFGITSGSADLIYVGQTLNLSAL